MAQPVAAENPPPAPAPLISGPNDSAPASATPVAWDSILKCLGFLEAGAVIWMIGTGIGLAISLSVGPSLLDGYFALSRTEIASLDLACNAALLIAGIVPPFLFVAGRACVCGVSLPRGANGRAGVVLVVTVVQGALMLGLLLFSLPVEKLSADTLLAVGGLLLGALFAWLLAEMLFSSLLGTVARHLGRNRVTGALAFFWTTVGITLLTGFVLLAVYYEDLVPASPFRPNPEPLANVLVIAPVVLGVFFLVGCAYLNVVWKCRRAIVKKIGAAHGSV
jgi:hypothetical protein